MSCPWPPSKCAQNNGWSAALATQMQGAPAAACKTCSRARRRVPGRGRWAPDRRTGHARPRAAKCSAARAACRGTRGRLHGGQRGCGTEQWLQRNIVCMSATGLARCQCAVEETVATHSTAGAASMEPCGAHNQSPTCAAVLHARLDYGEGAGCHGRQRAGQPACKDRNH